MSVADKEADPPHVRRGVRTLPLLGPAFVAAVAYVDPGNVATNVSAGARYGFTLIWVVVLANAAAIVVQYLSAKLGLVSRRSLAGHVGARLPRPARLAYWAQAEIVAIATDLAEIVGGAVALQLLFGLPLLLAAVITAAAAVAVLQVADRRGSVAFERMITMLLVLIGVGFLAGLFVDTPSAGQVGGGLVPSFAGAGSVMLASGIVGATVMPHAIYLHSGLTAAPNRARDREPIGVVLRATRVDVGLALGLAGILNLALLVVAATSLAGIPGTDTLSGAHGAIAVRLGGGVALLFAVALLGSGLASTAVGGAAGAEIMQGLLGRRVPPIVRRLVSLVPALVLLAQGADPTTSLVVSQVVLSIGIPFALVPLIWLTSSRAVMGAYRNHPATTAVASLIAVAIVGLNAALLVPVLSG